MSTDMKTNVIRVTIANIKKHELALWAAARRYSGTVFGHVGFWADGTQYGTEKGATIELALDEEHENAFFDSIINLLDLMGEKSSYVTFNGRNASLIWVYPEDKTSRWTKI